MEITQLEQLVRWLDEERKKDKTLVLALQERLEQQNLVIEAQAKELETLRQEIVVLRTDVRRTDEYPGMVEKSHRDLTGMVEELREQVRRERAESDRLRRMEQEAISSQVAELDKKIRPFFRYEEQLKAREAGEQRLQTQLQQLSGALADLTKRTEDRLQLIVYLDEQRRADARRLAALEGELPPLRKTVDELNVKLVRLEDAIRKLPGRVEEAIQIAKSYDPKIEELRVSDFQREQRIKQYFDQAERVNAELVRLVEQTQKYALLYNQNKQALEALEAFQARLDKRQSESTEMQRLAEERLKRQWEEWQAAFARDWQKRLVTEEDRWRRQDLSGQKVAEHMASLDEQVAFYYSELAALWEELRNALARWEKAVQEAFQANTETPEQHIKGLRRFAEEKHKELL